MARTRPLYRSLVTALVTVAAACLAACPGPEGESIGTPWRVKVEPTTEVDVLLVVDSTDSMAPAREALAEAFGAFTAALETGDLNDDGGQDRPIPESVHVAVITADLGLDVDFAIPTCGAPLTGDDGVLQTAGLVSVPGCLPEHARYQVFGSREPGTARQVASDTACIVRAIGGGCAYRRPLEAAVRALDPLFGRGADANAGFVREHSEIAVIVLSDADDCSAMSALYDPLDPGLAEPPGEARCAAHPELLLPVSENLRSRLLNIYDHDWGQAIVLPLAGIPPELAGDPRGLAWDVLDDPRWRSRVDPSDPTRLLPICDGPLGPAAPAPRLVEAADSGLDRIAGSLCEEDLRAPLIRFADRIARQLSDVCLTDRLNMPDDIHSACDLLEMLPTPHPRLDLHCRDLPGREPSPIAHMPRWGNEVCRLRPDTWHIEGSGLAGNLCFGNLSPRRIVIDGVDPVRYGELFITCPRAPCATDDDCPFRRERTDPRCDRATGRCIQTCSADDPCSWDLRCEPWPGGEPGRGRCVTNP